MEKKVAFCPLKHGCEQLMKKSLPEDGCIYPLKVISIPVEPVGCYGCLLMNSGQIFKHTVTNKVYKLYDTKILNGVLPL